MPLLRPSITGLLTNEDSDIRCAAIRALYRLDPQGETTAQAITPLLHDPDAGVRDCAVTVIGVGPDTRRLAAYIVGDLGPDGPAGLRAHFQRLLPDHMVPGFVVPLEALPLTLKVIQNSARNVTQHASATP